MRASIVSIDHFIQLVESERDNAWRQRKKTELRRLLQQLFNRHHFSVVFEESDPKKLTIAGELARVQEPPALWINIIMCDEKREAAGILHGLRNRPTRMSPDWAYEIEKRIPEDDVREDYFVDQILTNAGGDDEVLVLLGDMHVEPVARKLASHVVDVEINNRLVPEKRWED